METIDITNKTKRIIKYGLVGLIALSTAVGCAAFNYKHSEDSISINNARVAGTMVSVRVLTNGKVKSLTKSDGDEVKAGDVIAKIEVSVTEEQIQQLENAVDLAKKNYAQLQVGQMVKVPVRKPKIKTVQTPAPTVQYRSSSGSKKSPANLAALEERKNRMELLYEMGAVSRKEMEAAVKEYELAKAAANSASEEPVVEVPQSPQVTQEIEYDIEYVDQLQPTPPEILRGAELAIKQAELSLNVARQEAQQTEIIAPVDGTIYYSVEVDEEINAGDVAARVGDSNELWLEAELTESQFNKISLGKLVSYVIDGNNLTGTVIEKIEPVAEEEINAEELTSPAISNNETALAVIPPETQTDSTAPNEQPNGLNNSEIEQNQESKTNEAATESNNSSDTGGNPNLKDKYIVKFSLPSVRYFECKPNMNVAVKVKI